MGYGVKVVKLRQILANQFNTVSQRVISCYTSKREADASIKYLHDYTLKSICLFFFFFAYYFLWTKGAM